MKKSDEHFLRQDGWSLKVLNTLSALGYDLASYNPASCEAEFFSKASGDKAGGVAAVPHGITLHRQDTPDTIRLMIFRAGSMRAQGHARDSLRSLFSACGLRI